MSRGTTQLHRPYTRKPRNFFLFLYHAYGYILWSHDVSRGRKVRTHARKHPRKHVNREEQKMCQARLQFFWGRSEMERGTSGSCTTWVGAVKKTTMLVFYSFFVCLCMSRVNLMFLRVSFELKINSQAAKRENTKV